MIKPSPNYLLATVLGQCRSLIALIRCFPILSAAVVIWGHLCGRDSFTIPNKILLASWDSNRVTAFRMSVVVLLKHGSIGFEI